MRTHLKKSIEGYHSFPLKTNTGRAVRRYADNTAKKRRNLGYEIFARSEAIRIALLTVANSDSKRVFRNPGTTICPSSDGKGIFQTSFEKRYFTRRFTKTNAGSRNNTTAPNGKAAHPPPPSLFSSPTSLMLTNRE